LRHRSATNDMSATKRRACRRIRFVGGPVHALRLEREVIALLLGIKALDDSADEDRPEQLAASSLRTFGFPVDPFHRMCLEVRADGRPKRGEKGTLAELLE